MIESQIPRRRPLPSDHQVQIPFSHSRTRTTSSGIFPFQVQQQQQQQPPPMYLGQPQYPQQQQQQQQYGHNRRTPSVNTFSSASSAGDRGTPPAAYRNSPPSVNADLRRSTSSRSNASLQPLSYVALLRKQKATVWCDRAQPEDPYMVAKQKQAKMRALQSVGSGTAGSISSSTAGRTSTGLSGAGGKVVGKLKHHSKPTVVGYSPDSNYVGVGGVPLRLSATEVEGEDSDDDDMGSQRLHHRRTGSSGRSSTAGSIGHGQGSRRGLNYRASAGSGLQMTGGGSQNSHRRWTGSGGDNTPERRGSMVEGSGVSEKRSSDAASGSSSQGERADDVPDLGSPAARLASNSLMNAALTREKSVKNPEELRRRGSVDERTMTLTSGRLFIANPD